jgi:sec-independent protein translocase protein TatA
MLRCVDATRVDKSFELWVTAMFSPGMTQLLIVLVIGLLFFGNRLPSTMRSLGLSIKEFKKGMQEGEQDEESPEKK